MSVFCQYITRHALRIKICRIKCRKFSRENYFLLYSRECHQINKQLKEKPQKMELTLGCQTINLKRNGTMQSPTTKEPDRETSSTKCRPDTIQIRKEETPAAYKRIQIRRTENVTFEKNFISSSRHLTYVNQITYTKSMSAHGTNPSKMTEFVTYYTYNYRRL